MNTEKYILAQNREDLSIWAIQKMAEQYYFSKINYTIFDGSRAEELVKQFQQEMPEYKFFTIRTNI